MVGGFRRLPFLIYSLLEENTEENTEANENNMKMDGLLPECIRSVSDRFDVTGSAVLTITTRMCETVVNNITPHFNQWPTGERLQQVVEGFTQHYGLPRCIGAVDGTHTPIKAPRQHHEYYINRERAFTQCNFR